MTDIELEARRGRKSDGLRFFRFTPGRAIRELSSTAPRYLFSKPYAAFCLIFWAFLDGRPGKRADKEKEKNQIHTSEARRAGNIYLLFELHRALPNKWTNQVNLYFEILRMLEDTEGFANAIVGDSAELNLECCRENVADIKRVIEIIEYVVRYEQLPEDKRSVEAAKYFISKKHSSVDGTGQADLAVNADTGRSVKSLEKTWAEYVVAAPLLYGLYSDCKFDFGVFDNIEKAIDWTKALCDDQQRVALFLGRATAVAQILKANGVRRVREGYFKGVQPADLKIEPFAPDEICRIRDMEPKSDPNDGKPFRPRLAKRRP
jgi:hypothetical protein